MSGKRYTVLYEYHNLLINYEESEVKCKCAEKRDGRIILIGMYITDKLSVELRLVTQCRHPSRRWVIKCRAWFHRIVEIMSDCRSEDQSSILCGTAIKIRTANVFL